MYDWLAQEPVYTIPAAELPLGVVDLDIAADGTLVLPGRRLKWASPASPTLHEFGPRGSHLRVRIVGDRVAFVRATGPEGRNRVRAEIGVTDLNGNRRALARGAHAYGFRFPELHGFDRHFDFDGKRIAWYAYGCTGATMHVQGIDSKLVRESLKRCRLRFRGAPKITDGRFVRLGPNCYGYERFSCDNENVVLRLDSNPKKVVGTAERAKRIKLTSEGAELLEKNGKLCVRVALTMLDGTGTRERRRGKITLRAN